MSYRIDKINEHNQEQRKKIISSIEHNKRVMLLYWKGKFDKVKQLLIENIHLYNSLRMFKDIKDVKPTQTKVNKKEIVTSEEIEYKSKDITPESFGIYDYDNYLITNK